MTDKPPKITKNALKNIIYVLKRIRGLDKTEYPYYGEESRSPDGIYPKKGTRWATPREMATNLLKELGEDV